MNATYLQHFARNPRCLTVYTENKRQHRYTAFLV